MKIGILGKEVLKICILILKLRMKIGNWQPDQRTETSQMPRMGKKSVSRRQTSAGPVTIMCSSLVKTDVIS